MAPKTRREQTWLQNRRVWSCRAGLIRPSGLVIILLNQSKIVINWVRQLTESRPKYEYWLPNTDNIKSCRVAHVNSVVIIGANGSGKSKLGAWIEQQDFEKVHRISAQRDINFSERVPLKSFTEAEDNVFYGGSQYKENKQVRWGWGESYTTKLLDDFDDVLAALIAQVNLENQRFIDECKHAESISAERPPLPKTALDKLKVIWNEVFPQRKIEQEDAAFYAYSQSKTDRYSATQMSDGERSVLYLAAQVLCVPNDKIIIMDEPEVHLHPSLMARLWTSLEQSRPDCLFIYITHDVNFASTHRSSDIIWVKNFDGSKWELETLPDSDLPKELLIELLGNRKEVLFVEGTEGSYDKRIYSALFPNCYVVPSGGCKQVINNVKAYNRTPGLHAIKAWGIIDRDFKTEEQLNALKEKGIFHLKVAEIENLFLTKEAVQALSQRFGADAGKTFSGIKSYVIERFSKQTSKQTSEALVAGVKEVLSGITISDNEQLTADGIASLIDIASIEKDVNNRYQQAIEEQDYNEILGLFNDKSLATSVGHYFGIDNKIYVDRAISLLEGDLRDELSEALRHYISH